MAASCFISKLSSLSRPLPPFPASSGKPFWRKSSAYRSPPSLQRAGSCLNCPSLHTDPGTPGNGRDFGGALCPVRPQSPSCCRCSALGIQSHFPVGTECPALPPAGEHCQGLLFLGRTGISHSSPPFPHARPFPSSPYVLHASPAALE